MAASIWFISPWGQFPLNDDWVYTRNVIDSLVAGKFTVSSGQYAYAIPQVVLGLLLVDVKEEPFLKLRWIGILSGLFSVFVLVKLFKKTAQRGNPLLYFLVSFGVFFFIPFLQPVLSFMTDAPAFLLWLLSIWSLSLFLERKTFSSWLLAFVSNAVAVSERQLALFIPLGMIIAENRMFRPKQGAEALLAVFRRSYPLLLFIMPLICIQWWWSHISPVKTPDSSLSPNPAIFIRLSRQLIYLGWAALPFTFIPLSREATGATTRIFKIGMLLFCFGFVLHIGNGILFHSELLPPFYGNVLDKTGILPVVLAGTPDAVLPQFLRFIMLILGIVGAVRILWGFSLLWKDPQKSSSDEIILWSSLVYSIFICFRATQFDRYFIPILPLSMLCIYKTCAREKLSSKRALGTILACACYFVFCTTLIFDYFRWNEARQEAFELALKRGQSPTNICAGYEYEGWYQAASKNCDYTISFSELPKHNVEGVFSFKSFWSTHQRQIFLLKKKEL